MSAAALCVSYCVARLKDLVRLQHPHNINLILYSDSELLLFPYNSVGTARSYPFML